MIVKIWDVFFWATVLIPFFTGGVWIKRPGLFVELSEITVPLLFLAAWGYIIFRVYRLDLEKASSVRFCKKLWSLWTNALKKSPIKTLWIGTGVIGFFWSIVLIRKHYSFQTSPGDLAVFESAIWNLMNGHGFISSVKSGMNLLCDHQYFLFSAFGPAFSIYPHAETLLILQGFFMATGAVALFLLGRQYLPATSPHIYILPALYWAFNPIRNAVRFDFHPEILLLPLFLFAIWGIQSPKTKNKFLGIGFFILALLCKESSGPVAAGLGLAWILGAGPKETRSFTTRFGISSLVIGTLVFYADTQVVTKIFGCPYAYQGNYSQFGNSLIDVILAPITKPILFLSHVFGISRLRFLFFTLFPLAFFPLLNWKVFLAAIPAYLIFFMTEGNHRVNPEYYYGIEASVALLWALSGGILIAEKRFPKWKKNIPLVLGLCAALGLGRSDFFYLRFFSPDPHEDWLRHSLIPRLNPSSSVSASGMMVSHLANRHWAHFLPIISMPNNGLVDCIIYDPKIGNWPLDAEQDAGIRDGKLTRGYDLIYQHADLKVWQRNSANPCFSY